jgi:fumarate hydratase subunit beta
MKKINSPLNPETIASLAAGDMAALSGVIYTARDQAHRRFIELLESGDPLPVDLRGQTVFYAGPAPAKPGAVIGSIGPTTASRMDGHTPALLDYGVRGMIGKGPRSLEVKEAIVRNRAVYFVSTGGAAAYLSKFVAAAEVVAFADLGPEAVYRLEVVDWPVVVGIDSKGRSSLWPDYS